jgi:hypothetical protein
MFAKRSAIEFVAMLAIVGFGWTAIPSTASAQRACCGGGQRLTGGHAGHQSSPAVPSQLGGYPVGHAGHQSSPVVPSQLDGYSAGHEGHQLSLATPSQVDGMSVSHAAHQSSPVVAGQSAGHPPDCAGQGPNPFIPSEFGGPAAGRQFNPFMPR